MPSYDVECSACGHKATETMKIAELDKWDAEVHCPQCQAGNHRYARVIRAAPFSRMGGEGSVRQAEAKKSSDKAAFSRSSEKADMLHRGEKRVDRDQKAASTERAKKGVD